MGQQTCVNTKQSKNEQHGIYKKQAINQKEIFKKTPQYFRFF
jgi:hypothetical protein